MKSLRFVFPGLALVSWLAAAEPAPREESGEPTLSTDDLYEAGKNLFETFAPDEVKEQFEFPDKARWDAFATRLQQTLNDHDPAALAKLEPEARTALAALRAVPGTEEYINWLEERLDYIEAARDVGPQSTHRPPPVKPAGQFIPNYDVWIDRLQSRPVPARAQKYVDLLLPIFASAGIPGELVWLAEVESGFNPTARSPVGARGLFQLMPATAQELGLRTFLPDERTDPDKSAAAAARMLSDLHDKFDDWPLALAAYNAGAGRVRRTLAKEKAKTFAQIAKELPVETQMYVPKVLAMLQVRAGVALAGGGR